MMTFMFHLFSETIKCLISSLKHTAKLQRSPEYAKLSLVLFCCRNWANSHSHQSNFLPPTPNLKIPQDIGTLLFSEIKS